MDLGENIRRLRKEANLTQGALSLKAGVPQSLISELENGKRKSTTFLPELAQALGVPIRELDPRFEAVSQDGALNYRPPPQFIGQRDLPVYSAAEGGPGEMVVSTDPVEIVPRPWFMNEVKDGYAVLITGESMVPAYRPGEMAIVNPRLPPTRNQDTIFVAKSEERGEFRATIKHLLRWSTKDWLVEQYNPPEGQLKEFALDKRVWGEALRVVGKYNR